jgi:bisphosphoglycerate-dependent phosphoglycerate mutase
LQLTLLYLRFQRSAALAKKVHEKSIELYQRDMEATPGEINQAETFAQELLQSVNKKLQILLHNLKDPTFISKSIERDYLLYYHVADGCFTFSLRFRNTYEIKVTPTWSLTDDSEALPLLEAIKVLFPFMSLTFKSTENSWQLRTQSWENVEKKVLPFFKDAVLPKFRQTVLNQFTDVCKSHNSEDFKKTYAKLEDFIRKAYFINPSAQKRTEKTFISQGFAEGIKVYAKFLNIQP